MHPTAEQLKELQDSIHREKVMRARAMTESERFVATLELIDSSFEWMLAGVKRCDLHGTRQVLDAITTGIAPL